MLAILIFDVITLPAPPIYSMQRSPQIHVHQSIMKTTAIIAYLLVSLFCTVQAKSIKNATLYLLNDAMASEGAMCLDGSPTGYYFRAGSGDGANKWILHLGGGGWCNSTANCYNRSFTLLGSSTKWLKSVALNGFLSDNSTVNPDFYNWNIVYLMYCDGASFAGYVVNADVYKNKKLYYRGRANLKADLDDLLKRGMDKATDVILTGCSAGGLATYLHADAVRNYLPQTIKKFKAFPDAGYFLDTPNINGIPLFKMGTQNVFKMQNASDGVNQDCLKHQKPGEGWRCFFAPYTYPYVKTPLFVLNSMYDTAQLLSLYGLPCLPPNCTSSYTEEFYNYGQQFLYQAKPVTTTTPTNGYFIDSCQIHCQTLTDQPWSTFSIGDDTMSATFARWYNEEGAGLASTRLKDCEAPFNCNPTCPGQSNVKSMQDQFGVAISP